VSDGALGDLLWTLEQHNLYADGFAKGYETRVILGLAKLWSPRSLQESSVNRPKTLARRKILR
jgi:hypothetical protein